VLYIDKQVHLTAVFKRYAFLRFIGAVSCAVVVSLCGRICSYTVFASICDVLSISVDEFSLSIFFFFRASFFSLSNG
jgi:hypothetical protein